MARFRRINIDGKSVTETRAAAEAITPGCFVDIDGSDEFVLIDAAQGRMYIANTGYHEGLTVDEVIPLGDSVVADYWEDGREFAVRFAASTALTKDQPITVTTDGLGLAATEGGTATIVGYSQETVTLPAGATGLIRIRAKYFAAVPV